MRREAEAEIMGGRRHPQVGLSWPGESRAARGDSDRRFVLRVETKSKKGKRSVAKGR
jgi:hypothetical protein